MKTLYYTARSLGAGAPVLPRRIVTPPLRLIEANSFGSGFAPLRHEVVKA